MTAMALPLHLGGLHPMETALMGVLALAPFVILAVVVTVVSRRDRRAEREGRPARDAGAGAAEPQATREAPGEREARTTRSTDTAAPQSVQQ